MIVRFTFKVAALSVLLSPAALSQDFRGLRPGMDASALGVIGEPLDLYSTDAGFQATYPLPFGHRLMASYSSDGGISFLATYAEADALEAPDRGGLRFGEATLASVMERIGQDLTYLAAPGLLHITQLSPDRFSLVYDLPEYPDTFLLLDFKGDLEWDATEELEDQIEAMGSATFAAASLVHRDQLTELRNPNDFVGGLRDAPILFPLAIDEAFPSLIP